MSRRKIRKGSPQRNMPNEDGVVFLAIFDQYVVISRTRGRLCAEPRAPAHTLGRSIDSATGAARTLGGWTDRHSH